MNANVYIESDNDKCVVCGEGVAWQHLVDQTNDEGEVVDLKVKNVKACDHCNSVLETTYFIPGEL